jgi:hypothetical protein
MKLNLTLARSLKPHLEHRIAVRIPLAKKTACAWLSERAFGRSDGRYLELSAAEARSASMAALADFGASSWDFAGSGSATRAGSLDHSSNEKLYGAKPRAGLVIARPIPGGVLSIDSIDIPWPLLSATMELPASDALRFTGRSSIVVVENWENMASPPSGDSPIWRSAAIGDSPLLIWRGDKDHTGDQVLAAIEILDPLPVFAFCDYDSSGLTNSRALPRFVDILIPDIGELDDIVRRKGSPDLYAKQTTVAPRPHDPPNLSAVAALIARRGKSLVQEHFVPKL